MLSAVNLVANEFYFFARDAKKGVLACHAFIHARKVAAGFALDSKAE